MIDVIQSNKPIYSRLAISLTSIKIGWTNNSTDEASAIINDADISVLAYTGAGTPPVIATNATSSGTVNNKTFTTLLNEGWEFVGHYANLSNNNVQNTIDTHGKTSSYWLISAFTGWGDSSYTGTTTQKNTLIAAGLDFGNDYFKISGLGGKSATPDQPSTNVPEPTSLVLLALGLISLRMTKNNQQRSPNLTV